LDELAKLQDSVVPFDTKVAVAQIERELGGPLGQFFTSISEEPVAAASLAQVYLATLNDGKDTKVAIKVQRPEGNTVQLAREIDCFGLCISDLILPSFIHFSAWSGIQGFVRFEACRRSLSGFGRTFCASTTNQLRRLIE